MSAAHHYARILVSANPYSARIVEQDYSSINYYSQILPIVSGDRDDDTICFCNYSRRKWMNSAPIFVSAHLYLHLNVNIIGWSNPF